VRAQAAEAQDRLNRMRAAAAPWLELHKLIGVSDGKSFKRFAQALNLGQLVDRANGHLARLAPRYRLAQWRAEGLPTLQLVVRDLWQPGQVRGLQSLSGGESFLASLALALGLSDLRTSSMPIETLLLDEGFGTLDPATLEVALAALQHLQSGGRQVGIISHVAALHERIPARVLVEPLGEGRSRLRVPR
jgi:exonuclease SbcC